MASIPCILSDAQQVICFACTRSHTHLTSNDRSSSEVSCSCLFCRWLNYSEQHLVRDALAPTVNPAQQKNWYSNIHYAEFHLTRLEQNQAAIWMTDVPQANTSCRNLGWHLNNDDCWKRQLTVELFWEPEPLPPSQAMWQSNYLLKYANDRRVWGTDRPALRSEWKPQEGWGRLTKEKVRGELV